MLLTKRIAASGNEIGLLAAPQPAPQKYVFEVFWWSASSPFQIQHTGNFKLVFNVSPASDKKTLKLRAKTLNFTSPFPLPFHTLYIVPKTSCAWTASEFFERFAAR